MKERGEGTSGSVFSSSWSIGGRTYPIPLDQLPTIVSKLWERVVATATSSPVRARLHDLLFTLGRQPRHKHAEQACVAYLELGRGSWIDLYRTLALIRALDISRQMKRDDLAQEAVKQMVANARECIDDAELHPGVSLRLIARLVDEKNPPEAVDDLLTMARGRYAADPYIEAEVATLQRRHARGNKDDLEQIDREIVAIWTEAAGKASGLHKVGHLTKAIEYARNHGQNDLLAEATTALQQVSIDDLEMQSFQVPIDLSEEQLSQWTSYFTHGDDWRSCLVRYSVGMGGIPPTGQTDENRTEVENLKTQAPLFSMIPRVIIGGDGLPRWQPQNDEERELQQLSYVETFKMQLSAPLYGNALHAIGSIHKPSREDLQEFFSEQTVITPDVSRVLADALVRYWAEDYEGCVYLLAPKIETMLRTLARAIDEPVYQVQRKNTPGKYVGVAVLLQILGKRGLEESWSRYLNTLL